MKLLFRWQYTRSLAALHTHFYFILLNGMLTKTQAYILHIFHVHCCVSESRMRVTVKFLISCTIHSMLVVVLASSRDKTSCE